MKKTRKQAIEQICKEDNELRHRYESGKISKKEYNKKKENTSRKIFKTYQWKRKNSLILLVGLTENVE